MIEKVTDVLYEKGGGLIIVLIGIFLAIGGSYKFIMDEVEKNTVYTIQHDDEYHELDKRVTILEKLK